MNRNLTEKGERDLALIKRALETGDTKAYNELMKLMKSVEFLSIHNVLMKLLN